MATNRMKDVFDPMENEELARLPKSGRGIAGIVKIIIAVVVVAVIILALAKAGWSCYQIFGGDPIASVSSSDWQAVFLVNGQVYFGKVKAVSNKTLTLADIYYLQVVNKPLQTTQQGMATPSDSSQQELTLIKLGNEIHGPSDRMVINRDQVVLTEKLKSDSRVVQAISKYVSDQKKK